MSIAQLRQVYHRQICERVLAAPTGIPNIADKGSQVSKQIARNLVQRLDYPVAPVSPPGQSVGVLFEQITSEFLEEAFRLLHHLRPGKWRFSVNQNISDFVQYEHLANLRQAIKDYPDLASALGGDYIVTPYILIGRYPVSEEEINRLAQVVDPSNPISQLTPLREINHPEPVLILHASISCKWTMRSDRAQNIRTEALNLIRNRKGHIPHIVALTAEPLPTRLASLALGTGDLDCTYHFALPELQEAVKESGSESQQDMLQGMIEGQRLRDISDLPFDLAT
jgi:hypothetical protein